MSDSVDSIVNDNIMIVTQMLKNMPNDLYFKGKLAAYKDCVKWMDDSADTSKKDINAEMLASLKALYSVVIEKNIGYVDLPVVIAAKDVIARAEGGE